MIGHFDFSEKGWVSGKGRSAVWREIPFGSKVIEPQYLAGLQDVRESPKSNLNPKISYMRIGSATNSRTAISSFLDHYPAGDSVFFFRPRVRSYVTSLMVSSNLNSLVYDYHLRNRVGGLNLSEFIMNETSAVPSMKLLRGELLQAVARLALGDAGHAVAWESLAAESPMFTKTSRRTGWRRSWAICRHERVRLRAIVDACFAHFYGLSVSDLAFVLGDCDRSDQGLTAAYAAGLLDPKGLWRVERELQPELRHTVLSLVAFHDLQSDGLDAFLGQNNGEGWMLPETLRLVDYGLGHDERAQEHQPVASRLGSRFLDWQLNEDVERSWQECAAHAALIRRIVSAQTVDNTDGSALKVAEPTATYTQKGLF